jgi:hypothetical protein
MSTRSILVVFVLITALAAPAAAGRGLLLGLEDLSGPAREELATAIEAARQADQSPFERLAELRRDLPKLIARSRGQRPALTRILRAMGPHALYPMLERLAVAAEPQGELDDRAWTAWTVAMVDAVGSLRDSRAEPVLRAVLERSDLVSEVQRSAARALAKLGTDEVAERLVAMSRRDRPGRPALVAGMGHCRRLAVAGRLAELLASRPGPELAEAAARSLGDVGSLWAWRTPAAAEHAAEQEATRLTAARALVQALVDRDGAVRATAAKALLVVAHPATPALLADARRGADPATAAALDDIAERFARNPVR